MWWLTDLPQESMPRYAQHWQPHLGHPSLQRPRDHQCHRRHLLQSITQPVSRPLLLDLPWCLQCRKPPSQGRWYSCRCLRRGCSTNIIFEFEQSALRDRLPPEDAAFCADFMSQLSVARRSGLHRSPPRYHRFHTTLRCGSPCTRYLQKGADCSSIGCDVPLWAVPVQHGHCRSFPSFNQYAFRLFQVFAAVHQRQMLNPRHRASVCVNRAAS